ncbi:NIPSNAP family protein [Sphingomonas sp. PR090111-T3T-6A]|uniref:NIPSNAP family protein n=1 Tax=Sphingomonas sp. PR090111-T3T-6A TaxID=685778 RepID=UPI00036EDA0D|nr:NIPSNAP family protein [Sphingomonas sp. PR090111-T3T-6A]
MIDRRLFLAGATGLAAGPAFSAGAPAPGIFELRQYTLKGGTRAAFTRLFEQQFVASQNAVGSHVLAVFRDLDDSDRFVWMRGFTDMEARKAALEAFYFGPVWQAHRTEANAMMIDSDNVLLLKRVSGVAGPKLLAGRGVIRIAIHRLRDVDPAAFAAFFEARMQPAIRAAGGDVAATLTTEASANTFPRLPVREHDPVFLWIAHFPDEAGEQAFDERLRTMAGWRDGIAEALLPALMQKPEVLRLVSSMAIPDLG